MAETRAEAYGTAAGLLRNMGHQAHADPAFQPPGAVRPVTAIVTCAPELILGYAIAVTAIDPEGHLPTHRAKVARAAPHKAGDPLWAHWVDNNE